MAITDLTNTTWEFTSWSETNSAKGFYNINMLINGVEYTELGIGYMSMGSGNYESDYGSLYFNGENGSIHYTYSGLSSITITGGTDVTNTRLISWLEANGTQVIEMTPKEQFVSQLNELSDAINEKAETSGKMTISQMIENVKGISGGGLVGYSGGTISSSATFKFGLLEDGSITTTWNSSNKYVCLVIYHYASTGTYIFSSANITSKSNSSYFFIVPNANNWKALTMANDPGGGN